jgi:hypothetical protein
LGLVSRQFDDFESALEPALAELCLADFPEGSSAEPIDDSKPLRKGLRGLRRLFGMTLRHRPDSGGLVARSISRVVNEESL